MSMRQRKIASTVTTRAPHLPGLALPFATLAIPEIAYDPAGVPTVVALPRATAAHCRLNEFRQRRSAGTGTNLVRARDSAGQRALGRRRSPWCAETEENPQQYKCESLAFDMLDSNL
jgi:hypothetical protein